MVNLLDIQDLANLVFVLLGWLTALEMMRGW